MLILQADIIATKQRKVHSVQTNDQMERMAGKVLNFRGVLNPISVISATLSDWK